MTRQLKYKILKLYHTVYRGGGGISHGEILSSGHLTAGANFKGEGVGGKATLDLHSPFSPSFPFSCCVACHTCRACPFILSASMLRRLREQRSCSKYNLPDFTRHGRCHQVRWNVILLSGNIRTDYCVSLKSLSVLYFRYFDLQRKTWAAFFVSYFTPFYHFITRGQKVSGSFMS